MHEFVHDGGGMEAGELPVEGVAAGLARITVDPQAFVGLGFMVAVQVCPDFGFLQLSDCSHIWEEDELVPGRIPVRDSAVKACRHLADAQRTDTASVAEVLLTDVGEFVGQEAPALFGSRAILPSGEDDIGAGGVSEGIDGLGGFGGGGPVWMRTRLKSKPKRGPKKSSSWVASGWPGERKTSSTMRGGSSVKRRSAVRIFFATA